MSQFNTVGAGRRARTAEDKAARADDLLRAADRLERAHGWGAFSMADVAHACGTAKGTVFLYFPTRESLGLSLIDARLAVLADELVATLGALEPGTAAASVAKTVADVLASHTPLVRLLAILGNLLEHNTPADRLRAFKAATRTTVLRMAQAFARVLAWRDIAAASALVLYLNALVVGLHVTAATAPAVQAILDEPDFAAMRVDPDAALRQHLTTHLIGLRHAAGTE